ncbi:glycoside hydrolase superfamily [Obelidium mucronatum]|nr:glycoside hydrolase superfamily [Obelidium mucronatum]
MFISFNVPNLHLIEDVIGRTKWQIPSEFEQTDALTSLKMLGPKANIARLYTLAFQNTSNPLQPFHVGVYSNSPDPDHIVIPGTSNPQLVASESMFSALDSAISLANAKGIRLIIPFIDQFHWWGGIPSFTQYHNISPPEFYTNKEAINNFHQILRFVATRNNTLSGVEYRKDSAIWAWETGNELSFNQSPVPSAWTIGVSKLLKNDLNVTQNVIDGSYGIYGWEDAVLQESSIDGFTGHYYSPGPSKDDITTFRIAGGFFIASAIFLIVCCIKPSWLGIRVKRMRPFENLKELISLQTKNGLGESQRTPEDQAPSPKRKKLAFIIVSLLLITLISSLVLILIPLVRLLNPPTYASRFQVDHDLIINRHKKIFYVGEFGLAPVSEMESLLTAVAKSNASGALLWSLRFHSRNGGFYNHIELQEYQAYHFPGFTSFGADEIQVMNMMRRFAGAPQADSTMLPPIPPPSIAPWILEPVIDRRNTPITVGLRWRGSAGAQTYIVERYDGAGSSNSSLFVVLNSNVSDATFEGSTLFMDSGLIPGTYSYRVVGVNSGGRGPYSAVKIIEI